MRIYVVDNGGQWTHREWRVLRELGVDTKMIPNTTPFEEIEDLDGLILSGGAPRIGLSSEKMGNNGEYLKKARYPILGICAGHQFMSLVFGGDAQPSEVPEFGETQVFIDEHDDIFKGLPDSFIAWESHNDEVTKLPDGFISLAHSENCKVQAMKHEEKPLFGLQFHPEVNNTEHGKDIFANFVEICREWRDGQ